MQSIYFRESNRRLQTLPPPEAAQFFAEFTHHDGATSTACYRLTWIERLQVLLWGRLWFSIKIGNSPVPAVALQTKRTPFLKPKAIVPMVAKAGCARCHGTGSNGRDTLTGVDIPCGCLREKDEALRQGHKMT